ncbi:BON domain-containing protein [Chitinophaga sedimenti]|uniref:BON domain-containing protein n=1 Tax=Chitinophaga sedimenti TaxID=2033606 RepID=UPI0027DF2A1F|nr:BON domain-containing protein [Chitinophaga sedimenti]
MKTDIEIQENVIEQLKWEPAVNAAEIGVAVTDGIVTLSGKVDSFYKKVMAERAVRKVAGVKAVAENIDVGLSPSDAKTDAELAAAVLHALRWDNAVPDEKIKVKVENGVVTLDGTVYFQYQRAAAGNAVEKLKGCSASTTTLAWTRRPCPRTLKRKLWRHFTGVPPSTLKRCRWR